MQPETPCRFTFFGESYWRRSLRETLRFVLRELRRRHPNRMPRCLQSLSFSWERPEQFTGWMPLGSWLGKHNLESCCHEVLEALNYPPSAFKAVAFDVPEDWMEDSR